MSSRPIFIVAFAAVSCTFAAGQYFAPPVNQTIGTAAAKSVVADIDGDGDGDLLYFNDGSPTAGNGVIVAVNSGIGATALSYFVPVPPASSHSLDAGDIDGDGDIDVVTSNQGTFSVLRNLGGAVSRVDGTLSGPRSQVSLADLEGDGDLDAIFDAHEVRFNDGAGNFVSSQLLGIFGGPLVGLIVRPEDFDADGDADLVCAWQVQIPGSITFPSGSADLWVGTFRQDPGGTWATVQNALLLANHRPIMLELADVDGDGDRDMVLGTAAGLGSMVGGVFSAAIHVADVTGGVTTPQGPLFFLPVNAMVATGDTDGDGAAEVLTVATIFSTPTTLPLATLYDVAPGGFSIEQYFALPVQPSFVQLARFDADAFPDLVAMTSGGFNPGVATLTIRRNEALVGPITMTIVSGNNQVMSSGPTNFPQPFVVSLSDGNGAPLVGRDVFVPLVSQGHLVATNATGQASLIPPVSATFGGPFNFTAFALGLSVPFNAFVRRLSVTYSPVQGNVVQTNLTELPNEPIIVAYDTVGWATATPFGIVRTGILAGPAATTAIRDGIGVFGPADPTMVGNANGTWSRTDVAPGFIIGSGFQMVVQAYAAPAAAPWLVSNAVTITF
jgi:hypothetical protein